MPTLTVFFRLKCSGCRGALLQSAFSDTQLVRLRNKVATQGEIAIIRHPIRCQYCTGGGIPDGLECSRCREMKPLDAYTKSQRRDTDTAVGDIPDY
jgi:Stc1 domain